MSSQDLRVAKYDTATLSGTSFGSLDLRYHNFIITTTGAATATLPNGINGQTVFIVLVVDGGDLVITGGFNNGTTCTMDSAKDCVALVWINGLGWTVTSNTSAVIA